MRRCAGAPVPPVRPVRPVPPVRLMPAPWPAAAGCGAGGAGDAPDRVLAPGGRPAEPRRWSIAVVRTTTMLHRRGWAGPAPGRGLGPVMPGMPGMPVRRAAAARPPAGPGTSRPAPPKEPLTPHFTPKESCVPGWGRRADAKFRAVRPGGWLGLLPRGGGSHGRRMASHALWGTAPQPLGPSRPNDRRRRRLMRRSLGSTRKTVPGLVREWQDSMAGNGGVAEATDRPCVAWPGCQMVRLPVPEGDRMRDFGTLTGLVRDT